jgi:hypothetical protein
MQGMAANRPAKKHTAIVQTSALVFIAVSSHQLRGKAFG